jgi:hypothetical protein
VGAEDAFPGPPLPPAPAPAPLPPAAAAIAAAATAPAVVLSKEGPLDLGACAAPFSAVPVPLAPAAAGGCWEGRGGNPGPGLDASAEALAEEDARDMPDAVPGGGGEGAPVLSPPPAPFRWEVGPLAVAPALPLDPASAAWDAEGGGGGGGGVLGAAAGTVGGALLLPATIEAAVTGPWGGACELDSSLLDNPCPTLPPNPLSNTSLRGTG